MMIKFKKTAITTLVAILPVFWGGGASAEIYDLNAGVTGVDILPSGTPNFTNDVLIKYQRADNQGSKLTAEAKKITGTFNFFGGSTSYVNNLSYKLRADFSNAGDPTFLGGTLKINGNMTGDFAGNNGVLFTADLTGFNYSGEGDLIGFNTFITFCADGIAEWCTENESVYLSDFGGGFELGDKKFRADGTAITTIPVPAAVWLFGSGLLGLVGIARRKKAA